ncbi:DinB superfamily protein [Botrimarina colliarenosi]|uniref:DinB superfamily protein n=1 Tax=Botrimarina colliarenosi TaxID=2528001 RepID=A0A5C6A919_9BACT|nr:DinB family protein [Botrimarina colliarenosi]TWT95880.1 DinB superfamily protein [Botrimarina colliarenosi]
MNAIQAIQATAATSDMVLKSYVGDLSDEELLSRPHPGCNHIAWQLGHLIAAECNLLNMFKPGAAPELPAGFAEKHSKDTTGDDTPSNFLSKDEYLALFDQVRAATRAALDTMSEADLDRPNESERFKKMFPTVGSVCILTASHPMMHVGQFVPIRRELGKPVVI